ncbi:MAG: hypothetical protein DRI77_05695 [Chloroflexi bacterium]|nr:MAG: hypothetical protein DRI77_05695 [Chloroflexota bacterium]
MRARWQSTLDHPMLRLELRRIRRVRWWPGRRFFLFYPVVLGATLGCGAIVALSAGLSNLSVPVRFLEPGGIQMAALVTGVPVICLVGTATTLLSVALPWIAPALTSATIARERELGTLDLLRTTLLTERSIVLGKLGGCLARLWPGILALALLTPFQLVGTSLLGGYSSTIGMVALGAKQPWLWLLLATVAGWLKPWGDLVLNAAIGLFVSVLARASSVAVAVTYGAVIVTRVGLWSLEMLLMSVLVIPAMINPMQQLDGQIGLTELMAGLIPLATVLLEITGTVLLVWAAIWWLKRT